MPSGLFRHQPAIAAALPRPSSAQTCARLSSAPDLWRREQCSRPLAARLAWSPQPSDPCQTLLSLTSHRNLNGRLSTYVVISDMRRECKRVPPTFARQARRDGLGRQRDGMRRRGRQGTGRQGTGRRATGRQGRGRRVTGRQGMEGGGAVGDTLPRYPGSSLAGMIPSCGA